MKHGLRNKIAEIIMRGVDELEKLITESEEPPKHGLTFEEQWSAAKERVVKNKGYENETGLRQYYWAHNFSLEPFFVEAAEILASKIRVSNSELRQERARNIGLTEDIEILNDRITELEDLLKMCITRCTDAKMTSSLYKEIRVALGLTL